MSKKLKILLAVVAAVVLFAIGGGVAVMAQYDEDTTQNTTLVAKVAAILGITEQQLTNALAQVREQVANEAIDKWLANAVEKGKISETEGTAIRNWLAQRPDPSDKEAWEVWLEARPEIAKSGFLKGLWQAPGRIKQYAYLIGKPGAIYRLVLKKTAEILGVTEQELRDAFKQAKSELKEERITPALDKVVENGKITQDEANQIESWWAQRPVALDKVVPGAGLGKLR